MTVIRGENGRRMDLIETMHLFVRVVDTGSFTAVARERGVTQPTVSKAIAELERRAGVALIQRSSRGARVTEAGRRYLERVRGALGDIDDAFAAARASRTTLTGTLRVSAPMTFGQKFLVAHAVAFLAQHPAVGLDLTLDDRYVDLVTEGMDVAVRIGRVNDPRWVARVVGGSPRVVVGAPGYLAVRGRPRVPEDLGLHNCGVYTYLATGDLWEFAGPEGERSVRVCGSFRANNSEALRQFVLAGAGLALLPSWLVAQDVAAGRLGTVLDDAMPAPAEISVIYPASQRTTMRVRAYVDDLATHIGRVAATDVGVTAVAPDRAGHASS
ncbi:MAG: LysR family transcriptional regulator [Betaproteobacteria bacterium]|nr:LysR family transcriptional regulator [Betaproteobacteria bacterium]